MEILKNFNSFSLTQLEAIPLQKRIDIKFLIPKEKLFILFEEFSKKEKAKTLEINQTRITNYKNTYFDTPDFKFYNDHHSRRLNRVKIRVRSYSTSEKSYLEEKKRSNKDKVEKLRIPFLPGEPYPFEGLRAQSKVLHLTPFLEEKIQVNYSRITLANPDFSEKATFDLNLTQTNRNQSISYPDMVIAEVKQPKLSFQSDFLKALKALKCYPVSFSKYCSGVSMLYDNVRKNNFLPLHRYLHKNFNTIAV